METSKVISTDKVTVVRLKVTHENVTFVDGQEAGGTTHNTVLKGFLILQPKALGTVQVMIGVMIFIFGFLLTIIDYNYDAILVYSGITYWGSLIYISAGSLSVAAQNKIHPYVVKASFGMNVFSAMTAGLSIILMFEQLRLITMTEPSLYDEFFILRIVGIMLVLTIPQFIISICISAFACKANCNRDTVVNILLKDTESQ